MKRLTVLFLLIGFLFTACSAVKTEQVAVAELTITGGSNEVSYTVEDLEGLGGAESTFKGETYVGVPLPLLLEEAGFDLSGVSSVKAVAADGYSMTYDEDIFSKEDVLVAYATADGSLAEDDGTFRMVLPGEAGKLNVRMLSELQVETK